MITTCFLGKKGKQYTFVPLIITEQVKWLQFIEKKMDGYKAFLNKLLKTGTSQKIITK